MKRYPVSNRISFGGLVEREKEPLVPHRNAFPAAMMSLGVLMGLKHDTSLIEAHGRTWRMDHDHILHIGISGEAFRFLFDTAEYFQFALPDGAVPLRDCLLAIGLPCEIYSAKAVNGIEGICTDEDGLKNLVLKNLCDGFPVLIMGRRKIERVVLAIGYEDDGEILVAWTFSTGNDIPNKCFSPHDCQHISKWYRDFSAVALVKGEPTRPQNEVLADIYRQALMRDERFLREQRSAPYGFETNYYDNWIKGLRDENFWAANISGYPYIYPEIFDLAERRIYGAEFLKRVGETLCTDKLLQAIDAGNEVHSLMWHIHSIINEREKGNSALHDWVMRKKIVDILHNCRKLDGIMADGIADTLHR